MTMKSKILPALGAGVVALATVIAGAAVGDLPGAAATCHRSVAIDPQVTVSEGAGTLTFTVYTASCAAAGSVAYSVTDGTARRPGDYQLANGVLQWSAGDTGSRQVRAAVAGDGLAEALLEDFTVTLNNPSQFVRVVSPVGRGRLFDDDTQLRAATVDDRLCLLEPRTSPPPPPSPLPSPSAKPDPDPGAGTTATPCTVESGNIMPTPFGVNTALATDQTVRFQTFDGDLVAGLDYVAVDRTVTVPAGATTVIVPIQLLPRAFTQNGKHFNIVISSYSAGQVVSGSARVTVWR
ncbi:Calx-beta domain-containing protein [Catellatospora vulcania]|uniref:Calx-beta domain-containing protein n=1 Tax=Catellatospora vulcania TaxID=1460450 RepID=UPI0012D407C7|nr:Calx-beta domain-containing protein [Catellatospora vulcania]